MFRQNQQFLTESVQQENSKFADCRDIEELSKTVSIREAYAQPSALMVFMEHGHTSTYKISLHSGSILEAIYH